MIPKLTRRGAVAMATVGLLAGCSGSGGRAAEKAPRRAAAPPPGAVEQERAIRDSAALVARYDAVAAAHPVLAARLAPLRAETARHVEAFGGRAPAATSSATPSASTARASTATAPTTRPAVPPTPARALADLAAAERSLADRRATALLGVPGDLARLLASVAASGATHVLLLTTASH